MKRELKRLVVGALVSALTVTPAMAAGYFTNGVPLAGGSQYPSTLPLTGAEQIPADTELPSGLNPQSEAITTGQLASYVNANSLVPANILIGGDATTNLFQRATTGSSVTTAVTYGGPDRWAYWSGTGTAMTVSRDSTAADLPNGYKFAFKMARTSGQTGVLPVCMAQEVETVNSIGLAGSVAELDFHAATGANFSPTLAKMTAYVITGTGTDEGMVNMAFGLNGGGGGGSGWTGQANATAAVISLGGVSTSGRYAAVAAIPAGTTEVGVALCFTPTGTAGTNDYVAFSGIQLLKNPANQQFVSSTVGYTVGSGFSAPLFQRRSQEQETALQQRYYTRFNEAGAGIALGTGIGGASSTSVCGITIPLPTTMRAVPTNTFGTLSASTFILVSGNVVSALASPFLATFNADTANQINLSATGTTAPFTIGNACGLESNNGGSWIAASAEL